MGDFYDRITKEQEDLIHQAEVFFVATADPELRWSGRAGPVNLSPKGGVKLHIIDANKVAYLDYTGSGNETARHSIAGGPITLMVCSFTRDDAAVVRLYGNAAIVALSESPLADKLRESPASEIALPERQVVQVTIESTATSCGYGVPVVSLMRDRTIQDRGRRFKEHKTVV